MARKRARLEKAELDDIFAPTAELMSEAAAPQKRSNAKTGTSKRISWGFHVRPELVRRVRMLAASEGRKMYEVVEAALESYLESRGA